MTDLDSLVLDLDSHYDGGREKTEDLILEKPNFRIASTSKEIADKLHHIEEADSTSEIARKALYIGLMFMSAQYVEQETREEIAPDKEGGD